MDKAALALVLIIAAALLADGVLMLPRASTALGRIAAAAVDGIASALAAAANAATTAAPAAANAAATTTAAAANTTTAAASPATTTVTVTIGLTTAAIAVPASATAPASTSATSAASAAGNATVVVELKRQAAGINWEGLAQGAAAHFCVRGLQVVKYGKFDGYALFLSGYFKGGVLNGAEEFILSAGPYEGGWWWIQAERWWGGYDAGYAYFKLGSNNTCLWLFVELRNGSLYYGYALLNTSSVEAAYKNVTWFFEAAGAREIAWAAASLGGFGDGDWVQFNGTVYAALYVEVNGTWVPAHARPGWGGVAESVSEAWVSARGNCAAISWPEPAQPICP